jgi:predicted TIM-barrel fold metal-dependent hydrolase
MISCPSDRSQRTTTSTKIWHLALTTALVLLALTDMRGQSPVAVDHHQHLLSPATAALSRNGTTVTATDLIARLNEAGIERAVVLSLAYVFSPPNQSAIGDAYGRVKAENDWTSSQVAQYPGRLRGFCSVDPLKDYALREIVRCAGDPNLRYGLKLHFGYSDVDLDNPAHLDRLRDVFRTANASRMALVIHMPPSIATHRPYGTTQVRTFLKTLLPEVPDVPVQIAHLAGAGGYDDRVDSALEVFIHALAEGDQRMANVYFDASFVAGVGRWKEQATLVAIRIRQLGVSRVLYGSDGATGAHPPKDMLAAFHQLPLTTLEFRQVERNVAPYMR